MTQTHWAIACQPAQATQSQAVPDMQSSAAVQRFDIGPNEIAIVPVRNVVLFPGIVMPIVVGRQSSIAAAQYATQNERPIGVILQKDPEAERPGPDDMVRIGTVASVLRHVTTPDGSHHIICLGLQRFRVLKFLEGYPFIVARIEQVSDPVLEGDSELEALLMQLKQRAAEVLQLSPQMPKEMVNAVHNIEAPGLLADLITGYLDVKASEKQMLLEKIELKPRLDHVLALLVHRIEVMNISRKIDQRTKASLGQREREFLLREQLKAIQQELGEGGNDHVSELQDLRTQVEQAQMPQEVAGQAYKEIKRLERMSDGSAEYSMVRTYLDWLVELPWAAPQPDAIDVAQARLILDADHCGLEHVKTRILEFLAVRKLKSGGHGPILCLVGPPGVGKTSLGQSIAKAMGRKFVRVSLGGVHDEAEIRGHRRTYVGALPGNIIQAVKKAGTRGCVMMLDEIDKVGTGRHGDPSSALLEVLDPEQNHTFRDNYLALPFDLSQVLFLATANILDPVPGPLRDRMEVLQLVGYTQEEKLEIASKYLLIRQLNECGLKPEQLQISQQALSHIIRSYTREAGVRALERQIGAVCRRAAMRIAQDETLVIAVEEGDLKELLGPDKFENEVALRTGVSGVATGLAWTPVGGGILFIEASQTAGTGRLILTGQLGDVMKESAQAALTLVKSRAQSLSLDPAIFEKIDIHVHVPAGAIPKDGPSAGVAIFIALTSLMRDQPVRSDVAMTGEISLRGLVLPVGGIKDKVLAAIAAGIQLVLLPARNRCDLEELTALAQQRITIEFLDNVDQAMKVALNI